VAVPAGDLPCGRCRATAKSLDQKGTAVPKDTQRTTTIDHAQLDLPERVTVAVAELASAAREGCWPWQWGPACRCCRSCSPRTWPGWSVPKAATTPTGRRRAGVGVADGL
jgi:hypothetical protein